MRFLLLFFIVGLMFSCSKKSKTVIFKDHNISIVSWELLDRIDGISLEYSFKLHKDINNNLWISSLGETGYGLVRIGNNTTVFTTENSKIPDNKIWSITSDQNGVLWGGTSHGLFSLEDDSITVYDTSNSGMIYNYIHCIAIDHDNHVWFSNGIADNGGLMHFDQGEEWDLYTPENSKLPSSLVYTINTDQEGNIWTGHAMFQGRGGVCSLNGSETFVYTKQNTDLAYNWISELEFDKTGKLWVGTDVPIYLDGSTLYGSIQKFENNKFVNHYPAENGYNTNRVASMKFDEVNNLWASTGTEAALPFKNEVAIFNGETWLVLSKALEGFPNYWVSDILIDGNFVWMATNHGLIKMELKYS